MLLPVRAVPPVVRPRCPECHCFVRLDVGTCTACGVVFALASGSRRAETRPFEAQGAASQSGPKGNALAFTNLQPDGKIKRKKIVEQLDQMSLFQGVL